MRVRGGTDDLRQSYRPRIFRNARSAGNWTLRVEDEAARDVGTLDAWSLSFEGRR